MHPNTMAAALVLLCTLALVMLLFAWREQRPAAHIASGLAVAGMVAFLPLTQSRGALLGLGMSLALALVLRWRRGWLVLLPMGLAVVVAVRMFGMEALLESVTYSDTMRSLEGRLEMWSRGVYIIEDFPLTGIGMGTFYPVAGILYPYLIDPNAGHAHNLLLQVGVDLGLPGLVAWLAILLLVVTGAWELYQEGRKRGDRWLAGLGAGLLCSQVALLVHGMVDATSWITWAMVVPWGLWGIAIAARRLLEEEPRSPADPQARRANARTRS